MKNHYNDKMSVVEQADYLRYLAVLNGGGIYSDGDVELKSKIGKWLPLFGFNNVVMAQLDFLFGLEFDGDIFYDTKTENITLPFQICQWIFYGAKDSFVLNEVVEKVEEKIINLPKSLNQSEVMLKTGPVYFTQIILQFLTTHGLPPGQNRFGVPNCILDSYSIEEFFEKGKLVSFAVINEFTKEQEIKQGVILPRVAFGDYLRGTSLSRHYFFGFWKGKENKIQNAI